MVSTRSRESTRPPTKPIKLLVLAQTLRGRGTERTVVRLLKNFDRAIVAPTLVLMSASGRFLEDVPIDVPVIDLGREHRRTSLAYLRVHRLLKDLQPDCALGIHTSPSRLLGMLRLLHPRLPVICYETDPFTGLESPKGHYVLRRLATMVSHRFASKIIAASEFVAEDFRTAVRVSKKKLIVIPNPCVDEEMFVLAQEVVDQPPFQEPKAAPIVVNVGNMFDHKAQWLLLEALALLPSQHEAHLVIIGEGPLRRRLETLAHDLQLKQRVWFLGFQDNPFKFLARCDVYVSPSESEGFDIAQVEAMALGRAVIATNAPRYRAVDHGKTGLEVPFGDPKALADAIESVLESPELARRLGNAAQEASMELSSPLIARRYEAVIESLSRPRGGNGARRT